MDKGNINWANKAKAAKTSNARPTSQAALADGAVPDEALPAGAPTGCSASGSMCAGRSTARAAKASRPATIKDDIAWPSNNCHGTGHCGLLGSIVIIIELGKSGSKRCQQHRCTYCGNNERRGGVDQQPPPREHSHAEVVFRLRNSGSRNPGCCGQGEEPCDQAQKGRCNPGDPCPHTPRRLFIGGTGAPGLVPACGLNCWRIPAFLQQVSRPGRRWVQRHVLSGRGQDGSLCRCRDGHSFRHRQPVTTGLKHRRIAIVKIQVSHAYPNAPRMKVKIPPTLPGTPANTRSMTMKKRHPGEPKGPAVVPPSNRVVA